jgi:hypothetical protein
MNLRDVEWRDVVWIHLAQDRDKSWALVKMMSLWVP